MPEGYTRSPTVIKGALVALSAPFLGPVPNVILFQYNPETLARNLSPWALPPEVEGEAAKKPESDGLAQPYDPKETFSLILELDAADALEEPELHPVAFVSGVADRIAALEMLVYPPGDSLLGEALGGVSSLLSSAFGGAKVEPPKQVPVVLFIWGPGRVVPVRLNDFSVEEQAFSPTLYPLRAKVTVGLTVVTPGAFGEADPSDGNKRKYSTSERIAVWAYNWTRGQKEVLARANLANSVESVIGMLPL
jgi:hypothetical protein